MVELPWGGNLGGIFDSDWGYTLDCKGFRFCYRCCCLAAFNLLVVRPRYLSFVFGGLRTASARVLKWETVFPLGGVAGEVGLAAAILLSVAALLTETTIPARGTTAGTRRDIWLAAASPTPSSLAQSIDAGDLNISLDTYPGRAGPNDLGVFLTDLDGDEGNRSRTW